jgi:hypothetical protein
MIRGKINTTEIPKRALCTLPQPMPCQLITVTTTKNLKTPNLLILSLFKTNSVNQNIIQVINFKILILFYFKVKTT